MYKPVEEIARDRFIDPVKAKEMVDKDPDRYNAIPDRGTYIISTWFVNDIVDDYYKAGGERILPNLG